MKMIAPGKANLTDKLFLNIDGTLVFLWLELLV
jgi:hypothetical protein